MDTTDINGDTVECPYCHNSVHVAEEGLICEDCWTPFNTCDRCSRLSGMLTVMKLIGWRVGYEGELLTSPFVPCISEYDGSKYVDDQSCFLYECTKCKTQELRNCD